MHEGRDMVKVDTPVETWDNLRVYASSFQDSCDLIVKYPPPPRTSLFFTAHQRINDRDAFLDFNAGKMGRYLLRVVELVDLTAVFYRFLLAGTSRFSWARRIVTADGSRLCCTPQGQEHKALTIAGATYRVPNASSCAERQAAAAQLFQATRQFRDDGARAG
ncbi:hypothetical protein V8E36_002350 [Tilletia maclaganii]